MANDYQDMKAYEEYLLDADRKQYEEDCAFEEHQKTLVNTNRYQEALDSVIKTYEAVRKHFAKHTVGTEIKEVEMLRELVNKEPYYRMLEEKAIPKRPYLNCDDWYCDECGQIVFLGEYEETNQKPNYCHECGCVLDWSPDKSIPKKPFYPEDYPAASCPTCFTNLGDNAKCRNCDQTIDWSDDE